MRKICHITTVHSRNDVRIFHKECCSLSNIYEVYLIVADGLGNEIKNNVNIKDIGLRQSSRLKRAKIDAKKALTKAKELDCELYHFHDPELIKIGEKLKKIGKKVIYDTHEDLPRQIMGKPYLHKVIKPILARFIEWQENKAARKFDFICSATPFIRDRFKIINKNSIDINNYPILGELYNANSLKSNKFCYTGGITQERGIINIVKALKDINSTLSLAGPVDQEEYLDKMKSLKEWGKVDYLGMVSRTYVGEIMSESIAGIVTFLPMPNHINAQPNKIFEYMSSGIPVIGSDFDLWKSIIVDNDCGLCVNPENPEEIGTAMEYLQKNPEIAIKMGENGKKAVLEKYNWDIEKEKLYKIYKKILND